MSGWFAIKHGIRNHPIFAGRPERLGAWVVMLDAAAFADTRQDVGGEIVTVKRGELCASQAMLESMTGLTRKQLRNFLGLLHKEGAVTSRPATKRAKSRAILTICNYDKYQTAGPMEGQTGAKQGPIKEQDNNIPVGEAANATSDDPAKMIFSAGVKLLMDAGDSNAQARNKMGKLRKSYTDEAIIAAIGACRREGAIEPYEFMTKALQWRQQKAKSYPEINDTRVVHGVTKRYAGNGVGWITVHD